MTDLAPPAIAFVGSVLFGATFVWAADAVVDLVPAHRAAAEGFADRVDASDTTFPQNLGTPDASNSGVEAFVELGSPRSPSESFPQSQVETPPRTWTRGLPCRGCGPSRHVVVDEAYDHKWYGELWQDYR